MDKMQKKKKIPISNKIKISSSVRYVLIMISIVILAYGSGNLIKTLTTKSQTLTESKEIYKYSNKLSSNSKINLIENKYINEEEITDKQTYISDLISSIDMKLNYDYIGSEETKIIYNYKIEAVISATYMSNNTSYDILNKVYKLKESEDITTTSNSFKINENVNVNYAKYHQMIKEFKQSIGINANSHLYVRLTVNTKTNINSQEVTNQYVSDYDITLGDKIALISEKATDEKSDSIKYEQNIDLEPHINIKNVIVSIVTIIVGLVLLRIILKKTEKLNTIKNEYKLELNRIMRSCESKIVEIEDLKHIDIENATRVKDISQLIKLSDEALVPIYCYIKDEPEEEAYFIVTKYEKSYIFILR